MQQPGSSAGGANNVRNMLQHIQKAFQQQLTRAGPLVAGGGARSGSGSATELATSIRSEPTYTYKVKIIKRAMRVCVI